MTRFISRRYVIYKYVGVGFRAQFYGKWRPALGIRALIAKCEINFSVLQSRWCRFCPGNDEHDDPESWVCVKYFCCICPSVRSPMCLCLCACVMVCGHTEHWSAYALRTHLRVRSLLLFIYAKLFAHLQHEMDKINDRKLDLGERTNGRVRIILL